MQQTKPRWIWHFGDYEVYHSLLLHARRQEVGCDYPAMWYTTTPHATVEFYKTFSCPKEGYLTLHSNAKAFVRLDDVMYPAGQRVAVPAGEHKVEVRAVKVDGLPCIFVDSDVCPSDQSWQVSHMTHRRYPAGGQPVYDSLDVTPETFPFAYCPMQPVCTRAVEGGMLFDFGRETFGPLTLSGTRPDDKLVVSYGESLEEALDWQRTTLWEKVSGKEAYTLVARAFRYVFVKGARQGLAASMQLEYLPLPRRGDFSCPGDVLEKVWHTCVDTFHLNSREFFLDGIKRDRWVWSGDAYQSYMINNYLFGDEAIVQRTILALRGHDAVEQHINTILDYSLYWLISLEETYFTFANLEFTRQMLPLARSLMDFCLGRLDENGFIIGQEGDWVFVDWSDMDKTGAVCAEQMLLARALEAMASLCTLCGEDGRAYAARAAELRGKIDAFFWREDKGAYIDSFASGRENVTRHANIFAILYGFADEARQRVILQRVLKNDAIGAITTPYFKFFELDALCRMGCMEEVVSLMRSYWGGMLELGATSIWEYFDPTQSGTQHFGMYDYPYDKSLCHAWGAGPIYLIGRYILGVRPTAPGAAAFEVAPNPCGLPAFSGTVPMRQGEVRVTYDGTAVAVCATVPGGTLRVGDTTCPLEAGREVRLPLG
nr:alpha-rhamnosidase [bacterium]